MVELEVLELEEGWAIIQREITKLINILEADVPNKAPMDMNSYSKSYTTVYDLCTQRPAHDYIKELYERHKGVYNDYLSCKVLPAIQEKQHDDVTMLQELVKRWNSHKVMVRRLCRYFFYIDRHYVPRSKRPSLKDVGFGCFRKIVYEEVKVHVKDVVIKLINQEREGGEVDLTLLKSVIKIFVEIGNETKSSSESLDDYVNDFETAFLVDASDYYTRIASCPDHVVNAGECLQREKDRVSQFLHSSTLQRFY